MGWSEQWWSNTGYNVDVIGGTAKDVWLAVKQLLMQQVAGPNVGSNGAVPASAAWTCAGSSDGTTAGMDGVDRWTDITKVVNAGNGSNHSWIVLQSPATFTSSGSYYLLIDCNSGTVNNGTIAYANAVFTGGSVTNAPTSTNAVYAPGTSQPAAYWNSTANLGTGGGFRLNIARNATGAFYLLGASAGVLRFVFALCPLRGLPQNALWKAWLYFVPGTGGGVGQTGTLYGRTAATAIVPSINNSMVNLGAAVSTPAYDYINGQVIALPFMVHGTNTSSNGYYGRFPDSYTIGSGRIAGDAVMTNGKMEYVHFYQQLFPFNIPVPL